MKYSQVHIESIGYELPPVVVSTAELESRLSPVYQALKMTPGQLELLTGINERRWWERLLASRAPPPKKALAAADLTAQVMSICRVCRGSSEPAICAVARTQDQFGRRSTISATPASASWAASWISPAGSNSARRAGLVVSAETARDQRERHRGCGRSRSNSSRVGRDAHHTGAVAVPWSRELSRGAQGPRRDANAPEYHALCRWGEVAAARTVHTVEKVIGTHAGSRQRSTTSACGGYGAVHGATPRSAEVRRRSACEHGRNSSARLVEDDQLAGDRHQVGGARDAVSRDRTKKFQHVRVSGNMGTVSLPLTARREEPRIPPPGDRVSLLGIGSGLTV